ncbi:dihydrolipoamide acetyltransferase family protein [Nocardia sp. NPDC049190]|uniref:dihydrolipoamide acetyltransferase family protein n=1 Tax=Nocardia sp. NPDC049190 TaxID=3155650 RepID=UPI0033FCE53D
MPEITMPRLSDTMEDGVVSVWLKKVGDTIVRGEIIAEIETDKALMELEAYDDGVLEHILVEAGARVPIGSPIAVVGDGTGTATKPAAPVPAATAGPTPASEPLAESATGSARASTSMPAASGGRLKSSPLARKIARELNVDLATVTGTGPGGRITRQDVESAHRPPESPRTVAVTNDTEAVPLTGVQRVAAKRMVQSKQEAPHFYLTSVIDVTELLAFRAEINQTLEASGAARVSVNDLIVKAVAGALRADPRLNVSYQGDKLLRHNGIHLGVAVATAAGLVVPVIKDADRKSVSQIAADTGDLAERARAGRLRVDDMEGGTFTISNLGMFGIEQFAAVINPPQAAILAVGAATEELRLVDGAVVARKILRVTLSADHRAVDGATAAAFLQRLRNDMEHPLLIVT